jgi:hypothetical protein
MAVITQRGIKHTPLYGAGLSIPDANKQREFATWVESKEVRNTEFTDWMTHRSEPVEQIDLEFGQSYAPFIVTTLGAPTTNNSNILTLATNALVRVGDTLLIRDYYTGSTVEFDDTRSERATVYAVNGNGTDVTVERHEGFPASGGWYVHPSGAKVSVVSRAQSYNTPFPDSITYRGDSMVQYSQRFDSGEIQYDLAAVRTPDFEAPNGHYMRDIMFWKEELPRYRNDAFINGRKFKGDYLATPKIPYRMGGVIYWSEQLPTNLVPINGQLNIFDFSDVYEDLEVNHKDGPGDAIWMAPRMKSIWNEMLLPYKGMFGPGDTTLDLRTTSVRSAFGSTSAESVHTDRHWPTSKILLTSKSDWAWTHFLDMDWTYVERSPKELGMFAKSWTMGGDFTLIPKNLSHQRLLTGIDTRKDLYPARTNFL